MDVVVVAVVVTFALVVVLLVAVVTLVVDSDSLSVFGVDFSIDGPGKSIKYCSLIVCDPSRRLVEGRLLSPNSRFINFYKHSALFVTLAAPD
jgi:hypothetical protein